ncbi:MAG TPA: hypothetical protein DEA96_15875 [Leptospiraceae bacterium]|nr:hypothetical protein [Spirochaetaceae bacterium]HBS06447.1 hypothetical protein [Leptospiraceae bacterium]|tara:strand:- start:37171 stop:38031 length:861 start_codon:yes stop_codon:yes gene_type:complete
MRRTDTKHDDQPLWSIHDIAAFLFYTGLIAGISFSMMLMEPTAQSPEGIPGFLVWLLAIWSPNIAAGIVAAKKGRLKSLLKRSLGTPSSLPVLVLGIVPLIGLAAMLPFLDASWPDFLGLPQLALLICIHLVMGPLGEELGWRGFLYPALRQRIGWMGAALVVGVIWAVWHSPLWLINSPQSQISFPIFLGNVVAFSILMAIIFDQSGPSLTGPVLLHLCINISAALFALLELGNQMTYWTYSLMFLGALALSGAAVYQSRSGPGCINPEVSVHTSGKDSRKAGIS